MSDKDVPAATPSGETKAMRAGGRATEAGLSFQAEVGALLAAEMLARSSVGQLYGLAHNERVTAIRFEKLRGVDDVVVDLVGGGKIAFQCKTSLSVSDKEGSEFCKTIAQCVEECLASPALDPAKSALVIAVPPEASSSLDTLTAACRRVAAADLFELKQGSNAEQDAFDKLKACVDRAYAAQSPGKTPDYQLMARLLRVVKYERGPAGRTAIDGAKLLGRALYDGEDKGGAPYRTLTNIVRTMIASGVPASRQQFLDEMRRQGEVDTRTPGFDSDLEKLIRHSDEEQTRLDTFGTLPLDGYRLERSGQAALLAAAKDGSFLLIGEPGAGKSGSLGALARDWRSIGPVLLLSVDSFSSVTGVRQLADDLKLEHDVADVLEAWPSGKPGLVVIDALDAARGGQAETVFIRLIEAVARLAPRWRIVASVRTFDLLSGQRLRTLMPGVPPDAAYADARLPMTRHFLLSSLDADEQAKLAMDVPDLAPLIAGDDRRLASLLTNIFNLSIAADLIARGVAPTSFAAIANQSDLLDIYEDRRLTGVPARSAMIAGLEAMVDKGRLELRAADLDHPGLSDLLTGGILVERDDRYSFAHHIIFDHAAGRYFIENDSAEALTGQLVKLGAKAFMLAPALRFGLERYWRRDVSKGHSDSWALITTLAQGRDLGPIAAASALRIAVERVDIDDDLNGLREEIATAKSEDMSRTLFHLARFLAMRMEIAPLSASAMRAWAGLAHQLAKSGERLFLEPARFLLVPISHRFAELDDAGQNIFGEVARTLLTALQATDFNYRYARAMTIGFVAQAWCRDPEASRASFRSLLTPHWMVEHGHEDAHCIAGALEHIIPCDPEFAAEIFRAIFETPVPDDTITQMGDSRIMGLSSTRSQDFKHSYWVIDNMFRHVLKDAPEQAPALFTIAAMGRARPSDLQSDELRLKVGEEIITILRDGQDILDWRPKDDHGDPNHPKIPRAFANHVARTDSEELCQIVLAARAEKSAASVWRRLFGGQLSKRRRGPADALLWPVASQPELLESRELRRDTIDYLRAVYPYINTAQREAFEKRVAAYEPREAKRWKTYALPRLVSALPPESIATPGMRRRRATLERKGALIANPPDISFTRVGRRVLSPGQPDAPLSETARVGEAVQRAATRVNDVTRGSGPAKLWSALEKAERHATAIAADDPDYRDLWDAIAKGYLCLVEAKNFDPAVDKMPKLEAIVAFADRLARHPLPSPDDNDEKYGLGWSTGAVRVYASQAVMQIARRWLDKAPSIAAMIERLINDGAASVRYNLVQRLSWLAAKNPQGMWRHIEATARSEKSEGILVALIADPLARLAKCEQMQVEAMLDVIEQRNDVDRDANFGKLDDFIAQLAGILAVEFDSGPAQVLLDAWMERPVTSEKLDELFRHMRGKFFHGFLPESDVRHIQGARAHALAARAVESCRVQFEVAKTRLQGMPPDHSDRSAVEADYIGADRVIHEIVTQLYYGSGAYRPDHSEKRVIDDAPLAAAAHKVAFLDLWSDAFDNIEAVATPHTIKQLLELYEYLFDADPPRLFKRMASFLTGPAAQEYYQGEQLAAKDLVEFVRMLLADYRPLFSDPAQRDRLLDILSLFADAGWPEAMRLLWELPELLR